MSKAVMKAEIQNEKLAKKDAKLITCNTNKYKCVYRK